MADQPRDLRLRTKEFGLRVVRLSSSLPGDLESQVMRRQMVRCGTSVGAQYREACRARSLAEFRSKMQSALQELDETAYWFELLVDSERVAREKMRDLMAEVNELIAIFVASIKTSGD
ncbi:MAG TPA: four helix bundle protein [Tepidisphaeraceae bacterium]|nr:four helix bundle protein [Tepidisphaeraceae bacterium]